MRTGSGEREQEDRTRKMITWGKDQGEENKRTGSGR